MEFKVLLEEAFRDKLKNLIEDNAKKAAKKNDTELKSAEQSRAKVPPGTFTNLDSKHGAYWTANYIKKLHINGLSLYNDYVKINFDDTYQEVEKRTQREGSAKKKAAITNFTTVEEIRAIIVPLSQVMRNDMGSDMKKIFADRFQKAIVQYSDFAHMLSFATHLTMLSLTTKPSGDANIKYIYSMIPTEFQDEDFSRLTFPSPPNDSNNNRLNDYKNFASFQHL